MKFLIADDDARMRQVLKQIVGSLATSVCEARDGQEAFDSYEVEQPDWVLMDLRMKPLDGLRATALIHQRFPKARIVIVSQYDEDELRAEAAEVGACAYVLKENLHELHAILTGAQLQITAAKAGSPAAKRPQPESGKGPPRC